MIFTRRLIRYWKLTTPPSAKVWGLRRSVATPTGVLVPCEWVMDVVPELRAPMNPFVAHIRESRVFWRFTMKRSPTRMSTISDIFEVADPRLMAERLLLPQTDRDIAVGMLVESLMTRHLEWDKRPLIPAFLGVSCLLGGLSGILFSIQAALPVIVGLLVLFAFADLLTEADRASLRFEVPKSLPIPVKTKLTAYRAFAQESRRRVQSSGYGSRAVGWVRAAWGAAGEMWLRGQAGSAWFLVCLVRLAAAPVLTIIVATLLSLGVTTSTGSAALGVFSWAAIVFTFCRSPLAVTGEGVQREYCRRFLRSLERRVRARRIECERLLTS